MGPMSFMLGFIIPSRQNGIKNKIVKIDWIVAEFEYSNSTLFANLVYSVNKIRNTKTDKERKKILQPKDSVYLCFSSPGT